MKNGAMKHRESLVLAPVRRLLQFAARACPGATTLRVWLHRGRGVKIGKRVWIGYDAVIETSYPHLVEIQDDAVVGIRATIIAHFRESRGVVIGAGAVLGPGVLVLPNVTIGQGAVVTAGSVVTCSVPPMTLVQGNPAKPIAKVGVMLGSATSLKHFSTTLKPLGR
jgi:acetyltransferase-like isoleucine patch superfamily enzyme